MVTVNGQPQNAAGKPLAQLLEELGYQAGRIAVERNGEIVPKAQYGAVTYASIIFYIGHPNQKQPHPREPRSHTIL